jgi:magnesium transporter
MDDTIIQLIEFDENSIEERDMASIDELIPCTQNKKASWINIYGIHDTEMIDKIGVMLGIKPLFLEDLLNTDQRPIYEDGEDYDGFILKMLSYSKEEKRIFSEQITIVLGENYVLTLQEQWGDVFNPVRERIRNHKKRYRLKENDYLTYALLDTIIDNYILVIEAIGREIEDISTVY